MSALPSLMKSVIEPKDKKRGLYRVTMVEPDRTEYNCDLTFNGYEIRRIEEYLSFQGIPRELIERFEDLIRKETQDDMR